MKRNQFVALTLIALPLLAACSDQSGPTASPAPAQEFKEADQAVAIVTPDADYYWGFSNGVFWIEIDPTRTNIIGSGENRLTIPANSLCDVETTSYGASEWDKPCVAERDRTRFTIKPSKTISGGTRLDLYPHVRFAPGLLPIIRLYDPNRTREQSFEILYCASELDLSILGGCINEALTDPMLRTYREYDYFFRKLKHFSGYEVAAT